jgi:HSP20 family molecular chaperone IbpA
MEFEPFRLLAGGWGSTPAINMIEKENAYELTAELPGMDESNVELKVAGGVLTIKGEKKEERRKRAGTACSRSAASARSNARSRCQKALISIGSRQVSRWVYLR